MTDLHLIDGFYATADRYLWHPASATAVLSDVHLGVEHTLAARGMPIPAVHRGPLHESWNRLAERLRSAGKQSRLIIAGDLFDGASPPEETIAEASALFDKLPADTDITLLLGNHDPAPQTLATFFPRIQIVFETPLTDYLVLHGDRPPSSPARGFITGHQHPAVVLRNAVQSAKMICFATCILRIRKQPTPLILLPTFSPMPLGSNLLTDRHWILDFQRPTAADIRIAGIVRDQVLDFGPLDHL